MSEATTTANGKASSRMTISNVKTGRIESPIKVGVYGPAGLGKSTFAAGAPDPLWLPLDNRTNHLDVARLPQPETWDEVLEGVRAAEQSKYKSFVVDPVGWLEPLLFRKVTGDPLMAITKFDGGYGRGIDAAVMHWRQFISALERCWFRGMNIVLIGHSAIKTVNQPDMPSYDSYSFALNARLAGILTQWVDFTLFMRAESSAKSGGKDDKRFRNTTTGRRLIYTEPTGAWDAKWSGLPPLVQGMDPGVLDLDGGWKTFESFVRLGGPAHVAEIKKLITSLTKKLTDPETIEKVRGYLSEAGDDARKLMNIQRAIEAKLEEVAPPIQEAPPPPVAPPAPAAASPSPVEAVAKPPTPPAPPPAPPAEPAQAAPPTNQHQQAMAEQLRFAIGELVNKINLNDTTTKVAGLIKDAGNDIAKLTVIHAAAQKKLAEVTASQVVPPPAEAPATLSEADTIRRTIAEKLVILGDEPTRLKVEGYVLAAKDNIEYLKTVETALDGKIAAKNAAAATNGGVT